MLMHACLAAAIVTLVQPAASQPPLRPLPFTEVSFTSGLWAQRQGAVREGTLDANFEQCESTGRFANFDRAAGKLPGKYEGYFFNDSDVYKALEGDCYVLAQTRDPALDKRLDELIVRIAAAQQPDGYLYGFYTVKDGEGGREGGAGLDKRWTNLKDMHELYCAGHLIEAGVAHNRATGKRSLLEVAIRLADHIDSVFGPHEGARKGVCGHEEIELALVKLADLTGDQKYLRLAQHMIDLRGRTDLRDTWGEYCQDHAPVREHDQIVGHAVRASYLYSGVTDIVARTGDATYLPALDRVWNDLTERKMYITGGIGPSSHNEGFTTAYDLPNDTAYSETCASIGLVFWSHRLALLHADARYAEVMERALYNAALAGLSLDGRKFNYVNPLASRGHHQRQDWFGCACCPPNLLRLFASLGGYVYATRDDALFVNLYGASTARVTLAGTPVTISQETDYPWDGRIVFKLDLDPPARPAEFDLRFRVPAWRRSTSIQVNGQNVLAHNDRGYAVLRRRWQKGDTVEVVFQMEPERMAANPSVKADVGRVALQRGPIVYCFEGLDNAGHVRDAALPTDASIAPKFHPDLLGGVTVLKARGVRLASPPRDPHWTTTLYQPLATEPIELVAVPYFAWNNRTSNSEAGDAGTQAGGGKGDMVVWIPEGITLTEKPLDPSITPSASHCFHNDSVAALYDGLEPADSGDHSIPRHSWWPRKGSSEWVQYDFAAPRRVSRVEVYWFEDAKAGGGCRVPESFKVLYRAGEGWKEVEGASAVTVLADRFNDVTFRPVETTGLRIEAKLRDDASGGVLEWRVE